MRSFESWILSYLLNSLWQVPLLFAAGWLAARALRPTDTVAEHRVWVSVSLLQSLLPACSIFPLEWLRTLSTWSSHASGEGEAHVSVVVGAGSGVGVLHLPGELLATIAILYGAVSTYFIARFLWRIRALFALRREAVKVFLTGEAARCWAQCSKRFGIDDAAIAASPHIFGPVTMGRRRKLVLLPISMVNALPDEDLRTVIAHEFAHMHRNDFTKNFLYELLSLPVSYHPLCWLTRVRITESREVVCDQMVAETAGRNEYARSLLRLASLLVKGTPVSAPHTIGIFDANTFERRLMKLTEKQKELRGVRRVTIVAACVVFGVGTCGSALALGMHVDAGPGRSDSNALNAAAPRMIMVRPDIMAGQVIAKVIPKYPDAAKKAKIQGAVLLNAVIGNDGTIEKLQVVSGPKELRASALDAVRQWMYKPYLLNGNPIAVKTTVTVTYSLAP
jgi:TonB family protein